MLSTCTITLILAERKQRTFYHLSVYSSNIIHLSINLSYYHLSSIELLSVNSSIIIYLYIFLVAYYHLFSSCLFIYYHPSIYRTIHLLSSSNPSVNSVIMMPLNYLSIDLSSSTDLSANLHISSTSTTAFIHTAQSHKQTQT